MTSVDRQIADIEQSIEQAKGDIAFGDALARLFANRDFKKVVLDGFLREEAVRLVHLLADPNMQSEDKQTAVIGEIKAIGCFRSYLQMIEHKSSMARKSLHYSEEVLAELSQEQGESNVG